MRAAAQRAETEYTQDMLPDYTLAHLHYIHTMQVFSCSSYSTNRYTLPLAQEGYLRSL